MDVDGKCHGAGGGWRRKERRAVWRGRDSNPLRVRLVDEVAPRHPDLLDVRRVGLPARQPPTRARPQVSRVPRDAGRRPGPREHAGTPPPPS